VVPLPSFLALKFNKNGRIIKEKLVSCKEKLVRFINSPRPPAVIVSVAMYTVFIMFLSGVVEGGSKVWAVQVNGKTVALVSDPVSARKTFRDLVAEKSNANGRELSVAGNVRFTRTYPGDAVFLRGTELKAGLEEKLFFTTSAVALVVNGQTTTLVLEDREKANALLDKLKAPYMLPGADISFAEDIKIRDVKVDSSQLSGVDQAINQIRRGTKEVQTYLVKDGDTLWDIASLAGMSTDELIAANQGMNPERISIGQKINLTAVKPIINVLAVSRQTDLVQLAFDVEEKKDSKLYFGDEKVVQQGKPGKKSVTYQVTRRNGALLERKVLSEEVLEQPQTKIVAKGSKMLLASRSGASGRLAWPKVGSVISPFGRRGGSMHEGVDISGSTGEPVAASASGTVVRAGWYSGYGKCVDISHGDGVVTRYGHLSKISVSTGQKLSRGQIIGRVGSTGRSTGPHLHFEVIVNGQPRNPVNYL
jgi:murein DD-endopeptidase MepM/ murein hydrolase activator NlpD